MPEFLDFKEISKLPFQTLLDTLNIRYTELDTEIKGQGFIVNKIKNLYFNPTGKDKGSVINFYSEQKQISLREAAAQLKQIFLVEPKEPKALPEYTLDYAHPWLKQRGITPEIAEKWELGYCKSKGIMAGKIAIRIRDEAGKYVAFIGKNIKDEKYFFFKGFKSRYVYNMHKVNKPYAILAVSPFDVIRISTELCTDYVVGLILPSMSTEQEELLKRYKRILFLHPNPDNIALRLAKHSFVKAVKIDNVRELKKEDLINLF